MESNNFALLDVKFVVIAEQVKKKGSQVLPPMDTWRVTLEPFRSNYYFWFFAHQNFTAKRNFRCTFFRFHRRIFKFIHLLIKLAKTKLKHIQVFSGRKRNKIAVTIPSRSVKMYKQARQGQTHTIQTQSTYWNIQSNLLRGLKVEFFRTPTPQTVIWIRRA